ncbi:MAG: hypothetical protein KGL74_05285, partial [Elusimicrobia bacterium]|nr:hypothetical protein [Elusimicrobiota bacterium]
MTIRGLLWVALVLLGPAARGQTLEVRADPRVDLVGLVQQLAGDSGFQPRPPLQRALERRLRLEVGVARELLHQTDEVHARVGPDLERLSARRRPEEDERGP